MRYLVLESVAMKPHLETAGEIALDLIDKGEMADFAFIGSQLPWTDWALPQWLKWWGCSLDRRVKRFERLISERGVKVLPVPLLSGDTLDRCRRFARDFSGDLSALKEYRYEGARLGLGVASSLISWYGDSRLDVARRQKVTRLALLSASMVYERSLALIHATKPDTIITFNGRFATSKPIVEAATAVGIPVLRHERGASFDKYEIFDRVLHSLEYIRMRIERAWKVADPVMRDKIGHDFFARRRSGDGIAWFSHTGNQVQGSAPGRTHERRRIVYFSSSDDEYAATADMVTPSCWGEQIVAVEALIDACEALNNVELIIRVHPPLAKKSATERSRWYGLGGKNTQIIPAESAVDSYALLDSADVVAVYLSTIGIEAAYWGKPSILIGPAIYAGFGVCYEPTTKAELEGLLCNDKLRPQPQEKCLPYGYYFVTFGKQYRYYHPESLLEGTFLGDRLSWASKPISVLRKLGVGKIYQHIRRAIR